MLGANIIAALIAIGATIVVVHAQHRDARHQLQPAEEQPADMLERNFTDFMQIRDVLNVFSVEHVGNLWPEFAAQLNGNCSKDLFEYLQALEQGVMWAMQSEFVFYLANVCMLCENLSESER